MGANGMNEQTNKKVTMYLNSRKRGDDLTRVNVKVSVVARPSVKIKVALLASHDPDELVRLGVTLTNSWIVWQRKQIYLVYLKFGLKCIDYFPMNFPLLPYSEIERNRRH